MKSWRPLAVLYAGRSAFPYCFYGGSSAGTLQFDGTAVGKTLNRSKYS